MTLKGLMNWNADVFVYFSGKAIKNRISRASTSFNI